MPSVLFANLSEREILAAYKMFPTNPTLPHRNVVSPQKCLTDQEHLRIYRYAFELLERANNEKSAYKGLALLSKVLLVAIGLNAGLRIKEITQSYWGDFILDSACMFVRNGKGKKSRYVYYECDLLNPVLVKAHILIRKWKLPANATDFIFYSIAGKKPYTERALQLSFKQILQESGVREHLTPHSLRHTFAVNLYLASDGDIRLVQDQLGHTDIKTTQIYLSLLMPSIYKALKKMYPHVRKTLK